MNYAVLLWRASFVFLFTIRYLRTAIHTIVYYFLIRQAVPLAEPTYCAEDVTVVLPTILEADIIETLRSIVRNEPYQIILVVSDDKLPEAQELDRRLGFKRLRVVKVPQLGKRLQMVAGIRLVDTVITVFSDDDVLWHPQFLSYLLSPFEDARVGATGTNQRAIRQPNPSIWNFLGICYLERRNFNTVTTNYVDGSLSTLSGRTSAYRTEIVRNEDFYEFFINDLFFGKQIRTGDDKRLTMRVFSQGWKIRLVQTDEAVLFTRLDDGVLFLHQCLRWARSHWQGNAAVVMHESYWWRQHCWSAYATYLGSIMTPAIIVDGGLYYLLRAALSGQSDRLTENLLIGFVIFTLLQKTIKIWPHFIRHPSDMRYIPAMILFSYLHGFINCYAALTMTANNWGGRSSIEQN